MKAYKVATHRHTSEIEQELSNVAGEEIMISFTPHLIPQKRGILSTIYVNLNRKSSAEELTEMYKEFYKDEFFEHIIVKVSLSFLCHIIWHMHIQFITQHLLIIV